MKKTKVGAPVKVPQKQQKKPQKTEKKNPWWMTALYVVGLAAFVFAAVIGVQFLIGLLIRFGLANIISIEDLTSPVANSLFSVISYALSLVIVVILPSVFFKDKIAVVTRERLGLKGLPTWTDVGLAPIGYIASILIAAGLTAIFNHLVWFNASEAQDLGYSLYMQGWERGMAFILLAVLAPIVE